LNNCNYPAENRHFYITSLCPDCGRDRSLTKNDNPLSILARLRMLTEELLEEIQAGQGETLARAARLVPRTRQDRPVTLGCLFRWITAGVIGPDGNRVRLEAARLAGRWITTAGAIRRFVQAQTPHDVIAETTPRTARERQREDARVAAELEKLGV
jgi:hypothetical protein